MDRTFVTSRVGNGKYKVMMKGKNGEKEQWDLQFSTKGCCYVSLLNKYFRLAKLCSTHIAKSISY